MKTNVERVLDFFTVGEPKWTTNAEIRLATGIQLPQPVFMVTSELMGRGKIHSRKTVREWVFYAEEMPEVNAWAIGQGLW